MKHNKKKKKKKKKKKSCEYFFEWRTAHACAKSANPTLPPTLPPTQCIPQVDPANPSQYYDLSPLSNSFQDYFALNTRYPTYTFTINVCRPIVNTNSICVGNTGICEKSSFSSNKIGEYATNFIVNSPGQLTMIYPNGETKNQNKNKK